ncbi:DNA primase [Ruminococcus gauvreauii]|uniref:DNA primase n=1 Tax=Ruminococcus gauvreauii TaxID=438033 RepID=A0ABY5VIZ1_9FIRM|nr:DNA primase [Ruminococcus gauvreauii]UWP60008.1 DNA primase [Ruminococcus gauvreauii]
MRYSEDLIEEIRLRNDIVDVISGYVKLTRKGSSYFGLCPFHNEKSPSFSVSPDKQMYYCFGCGAGGNVYTFIMEYENFTFTEAVKFLAERAGVQLPVQEYSKEAKEQADLKTQLLMIHKLAAKFYFYQLKDKAGEQAYHYLRGRELSDETIVKFGLGYSAKFSDSLYRYVKGKGYTDDVLSKSGLFQADEKRGMYDKFWNRVMFPIMDVSSRVIGFGGRVMGDGKPKYLNSPETIIFDKSRNLYGLNIARTARKKNLIICEGYMDVIAMHQAGFDNAVASLGTALTAQQANLIKRYVNEALLLYDSDEAGQKAALRAIPLLRAAGVSARVIDLSPYKDPDEFIKEAGAGEFRERLENGRNGFMFQVMTESRGFDLKDPQGQSDFFHRVAKMLLEFEDEIERTTYLEAVAREYQVKPDMLQRLVGRLALKGAGVPRTEPPKSGQHRKQERENGYELSQKLLLTWMVTYPGIFEEVMQWISPEDFTTPLYHSVAKMLYEQHQNGEVNPARLLNAFSDSEEQKSVAAVFNARFPLQDDAQRTQALWDVICRMMENSIAYRTEHLDPADMKDLMKIMEDKKKLEDLKGRKVQLHISFD